MVITDLPELEIHKIFKMKKIPTVFWFVLLFFLINSCNLDNLDFKKLSKEVSLNPTFVAPIAKANISVWDLIQSANKENKDVIQKDPSGLIKIVYIKNGLYKYNIRDFLDFPKEENFSSEDKQLGVISPGDISVSSYITLSELASSLGGGLDIIKPFDGMSINFPSYSFNGVAQFNMDQITDYTWITLSTGSIMGITLENKLKVPVTITGNLYDLDYNRIITEFTFANIKPNGTSEITSVPLTGTPISNRVAFRMVSFETPGSSTPIKINLADDYYKITFDMKGLKVSKGNLKVTSQMLKGSSGVFDFDFPEEPALKAFAMELKKGTLNIKTINSSKLTGSINFILNEFKQKDGSSVTANIPLSGNSASFDLSGVDINLSADQAQPFNRIPYTYSLQVNNSNVYVDYDSTDAISLDIRLNNMEIKSIHGDLGKKQIKIDPNNFDMNVDLLDKINGSFILANPILKLIINNSIGVPASVNLNFTASNKSGQSASLNPPVFEIPVRANIKAKAATKTIVFDKQNSNIVNFIALPPTSQISYNGQVNFNPTNLVTTQNPNFLDVDDTLSINMVMELPMELKISNLEFKDTVSVSKGNYDNLDNAELILNAKNGIPLDVEIQLFFIDTLEHIQLGSSKKMKILTAAQVDASGVITPVQSSQTFSLDAGEMDNLSRANGIIFSGTVSSPSGGTGVAPIMADSKIELNVVIKSNVNL